MHFHDDALFPEVQEKLVITAAPYGPEWEPDDFREDLPLTMDEHVQAAVDCYNAGATVLHIHVRELDGKGSKRLSKFNELLGRLREAVPDMILQVGGSISFAPEGDGADAKWLSDDTRHMLAELDPKPDQVTIAINTSQMNIVELMTDDDIAGTSIARPELYEAYREMYVPAGPGWVVEHLKRLQANGIQPHFQLSSIPQLETVERLIRRGHYTGPLNLTWVAIGGGFDGPNPYNMMNFINRVPDGAIPHPGDPDAQRAAGQHDGHRHGSARALRQRGHDLGPQGREDHLGAAGRAARPHRERAWPRGRRRQGGPRHLPHRPDLRQRRRDACPLWATRPTASRDRSDSPSTPEAGLNRAQNTVPPQTRGARAATRAPRIRARRRPRSSTHTTGA